MKYFDLFCFLSLYFRLKSCWIYSASHFGICILVNKSVDSAAVDTLQVSVYRPTLPQWTVVELYTNY